MGATAPQDQDWRCFPHWTAGATDARRACAAAAEALARAFRLYGPHGRGPHYFDALGFVRAAVQAAWDSRTPGGRAPALADWTGYDPVDPRTDAAGGLDRARLGRLLNRWGLRRVPLARARPGDVILFELPGVHLGVLTRWPWVETGAQLAHVFPHLPPFSCRVDSMRDRAVAAYSLAHPRARPPHTPGSPPPGARAVRPESPSPAGPRATSGASR